MHRLLYIFFILLSLNSSLLFSFDETSLYKAGWKKASSNFYDAKSMLVWDKTAQQGTFEEAKLFCINSRVDEKSTWRLANSVDYRAAMCNSEEYNEKDICKNPRIDNLSILLDAEKNYWTTQIVDKTDNAVAYDLKENGFKIFNKNQKLNFVCVRSLDANEVLSEVIIIKEVVKEKASQEEKVFSYYFAPLVSGGVYTSNDNDPRVSKNLFFAVAELRAGLNSKAIDNSLFFTISGDAGVDPRYFEYPFIANVLVGPEYFLTNFWSLYIAGGLGVTRKNNPVSLSRYQTITEYGFGWKASSVFDLIQWGTYKHENNLSFVLTYTGTRTSAADINHVFLAGLGFRFFN